MNFCPQLNRSQTLCICVHRQKLVYTLSSPRKIAHNGSHAETWGFTLAIGGAFRSHSHIEAMKSRRKRMHALWRVSASYGAAAPLGCAASSAIWRCCFFSLCVRYFLHVRGKGGYHHSQRALHVVETPDARLSKRLTRRFLALPDSSLIPAAQNIVPFLYRCQKDQRDTRWSFHFCLHLLTCSDRHDRGT